jgi:hypothetical protein
MDLMDEDDARHATVAKVESAAAVAATASWMAKRVVVFDICSGKGLTSAVCAETFGSLAVSEGCEVHMVDSDARMDVGHLRNQGRITFHCLDVYDEALDALMARTRASDAEAIMVVVGVHLCGDLSRRAVELWTRHGGDVLVLSPCCLVREVRANKRRSGTFGYGLPRVARALDASSYDLWAKLLYAIVPTHVGDACAPVVKSMYVDGDVLGEKNRFITARRVRQKYTKCVKCDD